LAQVAHSRTTGIAALCVLLVLAGPPTRAAQNTPPAATAAEPPLTFGVALDLAITNNLELAAVRRGRAIRQAHVSTARLWDNPEFSAEITRDTPHGDVAIALPVDLGRVRSRRVDLAKEELVMADVEEAAALRDLRRKVRLAFYGLLAADEQVALADGVLTGAERMKEVAQARYEEGAAPRLDVMEAELGAIRARADMDLARSSRRAVQADLNALLNRPPGITLTLAGGSSDLPSFPTMDRATADAFASNVDMRAADREAAIEERRLSLLKAERTPVPTFSVGTALNAPGEFNVGAHAGVSVAIPLFSRNQGEIAASMATIDLIKARREAIRRQVEANLFSALERATAQKARAESYRTALVPTAVAIQGLAEESYRLGRDSILTALLAQRALRDVKSEYLEALLALQAAVADLEDILGAPIT